MLFPMEVEQEEEIELTCAKEASACDQNFVKGGENLLNGTKLTVDRKAFCYELVGFEEQAPALLSPELISDVKQEKREQMVIKYEETTYGDEAQQGKDH